jgi:hypothetical protein
MPGSEHAHNLFIYIYSFKADKYDSDVKIDYYV